MQPVDLPGSPHGAFALGDGKNGFIIYTSSSEPVQIDLKGPAKQYKVRYIDPKSGQMLNKEETIQGGGMAEIKNQQSGPAMMWVTNL